MSHPLAPARTLSEAWLWGLQTALEAPKGRLPNLVTTITDPGAEIREIREVLDGALSPYDDEQSVDTVAGTIFPRTLYDNPGADWKPNLDRDMKKAIDESAERLYSHYCSMLPLLLTARGSSRGTYFSRMISWPGKEAGGYNQLRQRILRLRSEHVNGRRTHNALDIDLSGYCLPESQLPIGLQVYAATDKRTRGFPCLVHVDFTLFEGRLHCTAMYRHHYFVSKAYGNYLGLSWLMLFLCQQSGYDLGELVVHSTLADAQLGGRPNPRAVLRQARTALARATVEAVR